MNDQKEGTTPVTQVTCRGYPPSLTICIMDLRALVVCPDQDSVSLLALILSELGMAAEHTPSISRGLELIDSQRFDAIVLDYRADQSSEQFLARLRQSSKNRASMLIAIVDGTFNARPVFGLGANFVLYRPLSSERTRISLRAARGLMRRERRRTPRKPVSSTANVACPGAPELNAALTDLSDGGTALQTTSRIPPACKVYFEFCSSRAAPTGALVGRSCLAGFERPRRNSFHRCAPVFAAFDPDLAATQ